MMQSRGWVLAVFMELLFLCGCLVSCAGANQRSTLNNIASGTHNFVVTVNRVERHYLLHIPPLYDPANKWPVVIMFHGGGGTAKWTMWVTGWTKKADAEGFLAVFPEGTSPDASRPGRFRDNPQTWNDGSRRANIGAAMREVPDVKFISLMLADIKTRFSVDHLRIYASGFSNGASMAFRVARELSSILAAVAAVSGTDWLGNMPPEEPIPLLYITGTADPLNPIEGGKIHIGAKDFGEKPSTQSQIDRWVKLNGCLDEPHVIYNKDGAKGIEYGQGCSRKEVIFYTLEGHGHQWPGGKSVLPGRLTGKNTAKLSATNLIWKFFRAHQKVKN